MAIFGLFWSKMKKNKDGFWKEMKSLPYESAFIFPQKCIDGKLAFLYFFRGQPFGATPTTLNLKKVHFSPPKS